MALRFLKNKLSEYVRLAAAGEMVVVTDRDRIVAEIVPPRRRPGHGSFIERGVREGWLTPATDRHDRPPLRKPIPDTRWRNYRPISIAIEKTTGDLSRQLGSSRAC